MTLQSREGANVDSMCAGRASSRSPFPHVIIRDKRPPILGGNSEPPAEKRAKSAHQTPVPVHETLPVFPTEPSSDRALFCEVFAGCERLSRAAKQSGFAILPVDRPRNEHKGECPILTLDLEEQQCFLDTLRQLKPQAIHVALPCGTGSRARERPVPAHLVAKGAPPPRPLRLASHPLGLPNLTPHERKRVESANILAKFAKDLFVLAVSLSCVFSLENPNNSWMWNVLFVYVQRLNDKSLLQAWLNMSAVQFSNCAHGG